MALKSPKERPELYDGYDIPVKEFEPSAAYREATMPSWMREAIVDSATQPSRRRKARLAVTVLKPGRLVGLWRSRKPIAVSFVSVDAKDLEALRREEISTLRELADQLEKKKIQPGTLVVDVPSRS